MIKWLSALVITLITVTAFAQYSNAYPNRDSIQQYIKPPYLQVGDTVAIVAPSGVVKLHRSDEIDRAKQLLESWGLHVKIGANVYKQANHFAGTDNERAEDFQWALNDSSVKAIWCARGGYGTVRILDKLDFSAFKKHPKWLIGYSDITALHNLFHNQGYQSIHALMSVSLKEEETEGLKESILSFKNALFGHPISYDVKPSLYNKEGQAVATLVGGNLTLLHTMLGSRTSIDTRDKIIFIEDIGEYKYHIDRMLQSLKRAGYFEACKGLLVGDFSDLKVNTTLWGSDIEQLILDAVADYDFPILFNVPAGHEDDNRALILGETVKINVNKSSASTIEFLN